MLFLLKIGEKSSILSSSQWFIKFFKLLIINLILSLRIFGWYATLWVDFLDNRFKICFFHFRFSNFGEIKVFGISDIDWFYHVNTVVVSEYLINRFQGFWDLIRFLFSPKFSVTVTKYLLIVSAISSFSVTATFFSPSIVGLRFESLF